MLQFAYPLLIGLTLTGLVAGVAAGKKMSGRWSGGLALGLVLALSPLLAAYFLFAYAIEAGLR